MQKIDATVKKETCYIAIITFLLSVIMQSVFLIIGKWDYKVITGNALGYLAAVGNFFLMGITVQSALKKEEKQAKNMVKISQSLRFFMLLVVAVIGYAVPVFNTIALIIPYIFPRIAIALRPVFKNF